MEFWRKAEVIWFFSALYPFPGSSCPCPLTSSLHVLEERHSYSSYTPVEPLPLHICCFCLEDSSILNHTYPHPCPGLASAVTFVLSLGLLHPQGHQSKGFWMSELQITEKLWLVLTSAEHSGKQLWSKGSDFRRRHVMHPQQSQLWRQWLLPTASRSLRELTTGYGALNFHGWFLGWLHITSRSYDANPLHPRQPKNLADVIGQSLGSIWQLTCLCCTAHALGKGRCAVFYFPCKRGRDMWGQPERG